MSSCNFSVTQHVIPCQYVREYPHAVKSDHGPLRLAIKEYRPLNNLAPLQDSVTIIAAHANGFPKETYEPLFDDLLRASKGRIRSIWVADSSHQGASGVLNEYIQGDDPNWFDHSRDLLCMVNHFQSYMPRPIIGIAHSMGAAQLLHLSLLHPRLIHGLALIEPIVQLDPPSGPNVALPSSFRQDLWPSRETAEASFRKNRFFKSWDSRVLDNYLRYGLRETPTALYPSTTPEEEEKSPSRPITLTTTKHQEAWSYLRSNLKDSSDENIARILNPNLSIENVKYVFHCPNMVITFNNLPHVRPNVLWIFGASSHLNGEATSQDEKVKRTGSGIGGSGGFDAGRVKKAILEGGHMLPFEKVDECASTLAAWLETQIEDFQAVENLWREHDSGRSERNMMVVSKLWLKNVRLDPHLKRVDKPNL